MHTCVAPNEMYKSSPGINPFLAEEKSHLEHLTKVPLITAIAHSVIQQGYRVATLHCTASLGSHRPVFDRKNGGKGLIFFIT